jgi:hypothetical protein
MVSPDEYGWYIGLPAAIIVFEEVAKLAVLFGAVHTLHIHIVAKCLEVPTDNEQIYQNPRVLLNLLNLLVNLVKLAVCAALNGNLV